MSNTLIILISFLIGIFCGRYFKVEKDYPQILEDIDRIQRILNNKNNKDVSIISPSKLNEARGIEKTLTNS